MWDRAGCEHVRSQDVPWTSVPLGDFAAGELERVLSRDARDIARTSLLRSARPQRGRLRHGADVLVLEGDGRLNGAPATPGRYVFIPPGGAIDHRPGRSATTMLIGFLGPAHWEDGGDGEPGVHVDVHAQPWRQAEWSGDRPLEPGVFVKWLRRGGPEDVFVAALLPGWKNELEEVHPQTEESFRIAGDMLHATSGPISAGSYTFRRPGVWHCPAGSFGGAYLFVRSSAPLTTVYREPPPGRRWSDLAERWYPSLRSPAV